VNDDRGLFHIGALSMALSTETTPLVRPKVVPGGFREIADLAYPVVLMVGRLGATELASVGFGAIWLWTLFSLFYGTASGVQTFVSQADGAGELRDCGRWAWQGLFALVPAAALTVAVLATQVERAVTALGPSPEMQSAASAYISTRLIGEVGFTAVMVLTSFFRGLGDTRTPLYVSLVANAVNAVLDYGLIFGELGLPRWGVAGALPSHRRADRGTVVHRDDLVRRLHDGGGAYGRHFDGRQPCLRDAAVAVVHAGHRRFDRLLDPGRSLRGGS
jgi:hypothetical protein